MKLLSKQETNETNVIRIAAFYHIRLVTCHLFPDGNGRLTRFLLDHYLQTKLQKQMEIPFEKKPYIEALKQSRSEKNLAPLSNILSKAWLSSVWKFEVAELFWTAHAGKSCPFSSCAWKYCKASRAALSIASLNEIAAPEPK